MDEPLGENAGSLSSEWEVSCVSPYNSDWTHLWNTYRFGLLLVLDRVLLTWLLAVNYIQLNLRVARAPNTG